MTSTMATVFQSCVFQSPSFLQGSTARESTVRLLTGRSLSVQHSAAARVGWKRSLFFRTIESGKEHVIPGARFVCKRSLSSRTIEFGKGRAIVGARELHWKAMAEPQEFTFVNKKGLKLKGLLLDGGAGSKEVCILCHGFRSSKRGATLTALSKGLAEAGVTTFRFDFSGNGESEGEFVYGNYWQEVEDLRSAVEFWTSKGSKVIAVAGHSKGGNCVVLYASKYHDVPCVINMSGRFALEKGIIDRFGGQEGMRKLEEEGVLEIKDGSGNVQYKVTKAELRDRLTTNMHAACLAIPEATRVLTIHGTSDEAIPADDAYQFAQRIPTHKLVLVKDADHCYYNHFSELIKHVLEFLQETRALQDSGASQT